jgi:hypothetical protein
MGKLYEDRKNLVSLFYYNRDMGETVRDMYCISVVYMDKTTSKLISETTETNSPYDIRPGSFSRSYEYEISYSRMMEILTSPKYAAEVKDISKYKSLNENNWKEWLVKNGYDKGE